MAGDDFPANPSTFQDYNNDSSNTSSLTDSNPVALALQPWECPAFQNDDDFDAYVDSISPKRELICPITQELFDEPVVCQDGHSYEKASLIRWFRSSSRIIRSPLTSDILTSQKIILNRAIQNLAKEYREKLGTELLMRCYVLYRKRIVHGGNNANPLGDDGKRIAALLDAGADTSMRFTSQLASDFLGVNLFSATDIEEGGHGMANQEIEGSTALLLLIQSRQFLNLCRIFLDHDASVLVPNEQGKTCLEAAEEVISLMGRNNSTQKHEWGQLIEEIKRKAELEKEKLEQLRDRRTSENRRNRDVQAQRSRLATAARNNNNNNNQNTIRSELGVLEDGWGYFPSLVALQFQSSIPQPPSSISVYEQNEKLRHKRIMTILFSILVFFWLWC